MIGQAGLKDTIQAQIERETFPRFSIFVGKKGSGRKTLLREVFRDSIYPVDTSVADIRGMISEAYRRLGSKVVYLIADADTMSLQAQNALLKVAEEPPNNAYIIITVEDERNMLDTIRSRGNIYRMENYTRADIEKYAENKHKMKGDALEIVGGVCETLGDVDIMNEYNPKRFYDFVVLVVDHVATVSLANALKIGEKIALKEEADKYSLKVFFITFNAICGRRMEQDEKYIKWCLITSKALRKLQTVKGINKQMLFDNWLFDIREWDDGR